MAGARPYDAVPLPVRAEQAATLASVTPLPPSTQRLKLYYWRNKRFPNFGDQLNPWLWPRLLPHRLDDKGPLFLGIGTILNDRIRSDDGVVVLGAGLGYGPPPAIDASWSVYAVRGPLTIELLGLPPALPVGDPAILVPDFAPDFDGVLRGPAFMPHWNTRNAQWAQACSSAGVRLIDPFAPVDEVIAAIRSSTVVLAEAMHAAIVADAFRVPWIPVRSAFEQYLPFKWQDWCASNDLRYAPQRLIRPWTRTENDNLPRRIMKATAGPTRIAIAARQMRRVLRNTPPLLSRASALGRCRESLYCAIDRLKADAHCFDLP